MRKSVAVFFLFGLFLLACITGAAAAPAESVRIGAVTLTEGQYLEQGGTAPTTTKPEYDYAYFADGTLTLSGFDLTYTQTGDNRGTIYADGDLRIICYNTQTINSKVADDYTGVSTCLYVTGNLEIEAKNSSAQVAFQDNAGTAASSRYGIYAGGSMTITNNGSIVAKGGRSGSTDGASAGIYSKGNLTISGMGYVACWGGPQSGGTSTYGRSFGIYSGGNIIINGGSISANGDDMVRSSYGIHASKNITISGSGTTVDALGSDATQLSVGISSADGVITIEDGEIYLRGGSGITSCGFGSNTMQRVVVNGGTVIAAGGLLIGRGGVSCGFHGLSLTQNGGTLTLSGTNTAYTGMNTSRAIYSGNVTINSGTFIARGGNYALQSLPNLEGYAAPKLTASTNYAGSSAADYNADNLSSYKWVRVVPGVNVKVDVVNPEYGSVIGAGVYSKGDTVTLTAVPNPGYTLTSWRHGNKYTSAETYTFTVTEDVTLTATFDIKKYYVAVYDGTGSGTFAPGDQVSVSAMDKHSSGLDFDRWTATGVALANAQLTSSSITFTMPASRVDLRPTYKAATHKAHAPCGDTACKDSSHSGHSAVTYTAWDGSSPLNLSSGNNYIYLAKDVYTKNTISVGSDQTLYLCLNGNDLIGDFGYYDQSVISVSGSGKLILCDCYGDNVNNWGRITTSRYGRGIKGNGSGEIEMYGGSIANNIVGKRTSNYDSSNWLGGGVSLSNGMSFIMYDGAITNNKTYDPAGYSVGYGGGVYVYSAASFTMHGGVISGNEAYKGGGIYSNSVNQPNTHVTITGGAISGNTATEGAGIFSFRNNLSTGVVDVDITGGTISGNTASSSGGGLMLDHVNARILDCAITGNKSGSSGAGIYDCNSLIRLTDATITGNTVTGEYSYGGGIYVLDDAYYSDAVYISGDVNITGNTGKPSYTTEACNVYLNSGACLYLDGALTGQVNVYTKDIPTADVPVRYLKASGTYTLTARDLANTSSDRSGTYFSIKNIDQENYGIFGKVQYKVKLAAVKDGTLTASKITATVGSQITLSTAANNGYELTSLTVSGADGETVSLSGGTFTMPEQDVTVTAVYSPISYNITYELDGGSNSSNPTVYSVESEDITLIAPIKPGYDFAGWMGSDLSEVTKTVTISAGSTGDRAYTATWAPSTDMAYTVKHLFENVEGSAYVPDDTVEQILTGTTGTQTTAAALPRNGFTAQPVVQKSIAADGMTVVEIRYSRNSYTLTFKLDNGAADVSSTVKYGAAITAPTTPTKTGYTFMGWTPEVAAAMPAADTTYTAVWAVKQITVTFSANGGNGSMNAVAIPAGQYHLPICSFEAPLCKQFKGWALTADGSILTSPCMLMEDTVLYAIWEIVPGLGDADGNDVIDAYDALRVLQYDAGWDVTLNAANADMNRDGRISISDALLILKYCAGGDLTSALRALKEMTDELEISTLEIVEQPADQYAEVGNSTRFTVLANGDALEYQWYINRGDGNGWCKLNGAVHATYITSATELDNDGLQYRCVITDEYGNEVTSEVAVLHIIHELPNTGDAAAPLKWLVVCILSAIGMVHMNKKRKMA